MGVPMPAVRVRSWCSGPDAANQTLYRTLTDEVVVSRIEQQIALPTTP